MTDAQLVDLWGNTVDPYVKLVERYGVWPTTVWDCDSSDPTTRKLKALVGDDGEARPEVLNKPNKDGTPGKSVYRGHVQSSVFNPAVVAWALNMFAPEPPARVFDPFAGGGTRAIVAAAKGYDYFGTELRPAEVAAVNDRLSRAGVTANVEEGDARWTPFENDSADFLLTCPPYWNLEQYEGGTADLSMEPTYAGFLDSLHAVVEESARVLRPGALAVWVTGLLREKDGTLRAIPHDLARLHTEAGFTFREEVILNQTGTGAIQRVGNFERGDRRLVRVHEYLSVFRRGEGRP